MDKKYILGGYELFKKIENKPIKELSGADIRLLNTCSIYTDEDKVDACVRGFFEGAVYSKEISEEEINRLKKELER